MNTLLKTGAGLSQSCSVTPAQRFKGMGGQPKAKSLPALLCQIRSSQRWETAIWVGLGIAALLLVVLCFEPV